MSLYSYIHDMCMRVFVCEGVKSVAERELAGSQVCMCVCLCVCVCV